MNFCIFSVNMTSLGTAGKLIPNIAADQGRNTSPALPVYHGNIVLNYCITNRACLAL